METSELFYYLISRRELITKLNICEPEQVPKINSVNIKFIFSPRKKKKIDEIDYYKVFFIFEKIFDRALASKFLKKKAILNFKKQGKAVIELNLRGLDLYKFFFKLHIFMSKDQKKFCEYNDLNNFNLGLEKVKKEETGRITMSNLIKEFTRKLSKGDMRFKENRLKDNKLKTYWDNFDMFINLSDDLLVGPSFSESKQFSLTFNGSKNSLGTVRLFILLFSSLRVVEYFKLP